VPPTPKSEKNIYVKFGHFSSKIFVKFGHFVNFSYIFSGKNVTCRPQGHRVACPHVPCCIMDASCDTWLTEMKCQFRGPTATRCCSWFTIAAMPASFSGVTVIQSRPAFTAVASILGGVFLSPQCFSLSVGIYTL